MAYLVFDLGTSGGKSAVVGEDGKILALTKENWAAKESPGLEGVGREFEPAEIKSRLLDCAKSALKASGLGRDEIRAIASTSLRFGYVFMDREDHVLYYGSNMDGRGFFEQGAFIDAAGDQTQEVTGLYPPMLFCLPKLLWFKENTPSLYQKIAKIMNLNDWWTYTLSGAYLTDQSSASTTGLFNIRKHNWSEELLGAFGLDSTMLPEVHESGKAAADLSGEFREALGIGKAVVVLAGPDTQCGLLGTGSVSPGDLGVVAGATSPCQEVVESLPTTLGKRLLVGEYLLPGKYVAESNAGPCGLLYDWAVKLYAGADEDPYRRAEQLISRTADGPTGVLSMLGGQIMILEKMHVLRPAVSVFPSPLMGDMDRADPGVFLKAVIEELCYAASCNVDAVEEFTGVSASRLRLTGGMARNGAFLRILSSTSGKDVCASLDPNGTLVGVALCGMVGSGQYASLHEACQKTELMNPPVHPDDSSQRYSEAKQRWKGLYLKMLGLAEDGDL